MRKVLLVLLICASSLPVFAQNDTATIKPLSTDSAMRVLKEIQDRMDSSLQRPMYQESAEQMQNNLQSLMRVQEERRSKEKRNAMIRIAIGVAGFIILIIGLLRRKKSAK